MDAYVSGPGQKTISRLYKGLQQMKGSSWHVKQKWEKEGNLVLSEEDWEYLCEIQWKTSNSTLWREFCWKTLIRLFVTPAQKRHYSNSSIFSLYVGDNVDAPRPEMGVSHTYASLKQFSSLNLQVSSKSQVIFVRVESSQVKS